MTRIVPGEHTQRSFVLSLYKPIRLFFAIVSASTWHEASIRSRSLAIMMLMMCHHGDDGYMTSRPIAVQTETFLFYRIDTAVHIIRILLGWSCLSVR